MTTFVLVPGFWLGAWAWRDVTDALRTAGHEVHPVTLTGVADRAAEATPDVGLETHTADIVGLVEEADLRDVVLVGHSGGGMPVSQAVDRIPDRMARVVYVDSGPLPDGMAQIDTDPSARDRLRARIGDGHLLPPPSWDPLDDPANLAGLDDDALRLLRERSTPHPLRAATDPVRYTGGRPVPATLVACTFPVPVVEQMIAERHPFFALLAGAQVIGLPTGHWPMLSSPRALADALATL